MMNGLPAPDPGALAHSALVGETIREHIRNAGGWISFSSFMALALYAPGLGYYVAGTRKFGADGDFVTAPEMSSLFGMALATQIADVLAVTGGGILELGAGTGAMAAQVLERLEKLDILPATYSILEPSPELRERQRETLLREAAGSVARVRWLDALPETWTGVIVGNEVLDALPVEMLMQRGSERFRRGVALDAEGNFGWADQALTVADDPDYQSLDALFPGGDYQSEIGRDAERLTLTLGGLLRQGLLLWIDYGFPEREFYHPQRSTGTLMCHYRHRSHADPFLLPGLQDITAHVDFTAIARAASDAGLELAGYTTQANFLIDCGIAELLQESGEPGSVAYLRASSAVQRLLSPAEMGELFKVIAFTRNFDQPLRGFATGDRSSRL